MTEITVRASATYAVRIAPGLLERAGTEIARTLGVCGAALVTDENVSALYGDRVEGALKDAGFSVCRFVFPAGEASKTLETYGKLLNFLAENGLTRSDLIVALGGGVTGDLAGFAAASYLRGVRFVQMPTTLLAAIDSSVGGKTAVNLTAGKNLAGAFFQPSLVLCDPDCFKSLPPDVLADGIAEAVKTGVIADEGLFETFQGGNLPPMTQLVARCVAIKVEIVGGDEFDRGQRQLLNLGHTAGHAVERCSDYRIAHGHAVAIGMAIAARAADRLGLSEAPVAQRIIETLQSHGLPTESPYPADTLLPAMLSDKKRAGGEITLVNPAAIGRCELIKYPVSELQAWLRAGTGEAS